MPWQIGKPHSSTPKTYGMRDELFFGEPGNECLKKNEKKGEKR